MTFSLKTQLTSDTPRLAYDVEKLIKSICFNLHLGKKKHDLIRELVQDAATYYKEDGYHNFKHALIAAEAAAELTANANMFFAMLMHDAHWSKTRDDHNVFASMYRAAKLYYKYKDRLKLSLKLILEAIAYTCFKDGKFINKDSTFVYETVHAVDLYAATRYDIWPDQYLGLLDECGIEPNLATFYEHVKFIEDDCALTRYARFSTQALAYEYRLFLRKARAKLDIASIPNLITDFDVKYGVLPNALLINSIRYDVLTKVPLAAMNLKRVLNHYELTPIVSHNVEFGVALI